MRFSKYLPALSVGVLALALVATGCTSGPKKVEATSSVEGNAQTNGGIPKSPFSDVISSGTNNGNSFEDELHTVVLMESLPTERYVYLRVQENGDEYWIATRKMEVEVGQTYYYLGGLLKTNFESKEYNRTFDRIYLVSKLVSHQHGGNQPHTNPVAIDTHGPDGGGTLPSRDQNEGAEAATGGITSIAQLVAHPENFVGKTVRLQGKCTKLNPNIMDRNWIHLQDGSADEFDLVITSNELVREGESVLIEGVVAQNRNFGAGYEYSLIIEGGKLVRRL